MLNPKQQEIAKKIAPEVFLKQILSGSYQVIENNKVFYTNDKFILQNLMNSTDVDFCNSIDEFKNKLESGKPNVLIDANLINNILLREILLSSSQSKNIILGEF